jgi:hypothetical protein
MTTPIDSTSPFAGSTPTGTDFKEASSGTEDFSIRTMHDDLLSMQKGEAPTGTPVATSSPKTPSSQPTTESQNSAGAILFQPPATEKIFLEKSADTSIAPSITPTKKDFSELVEVPVPEKSSSGSSVLYKILLGVAVFFVVAIAGLGVYYFFLKNKTIIETPATTPVAPPAETPVAPPITTPAEKYSSNMPNYLSFDPTNENLTDLNKTLASIADELKNKDPQSIYEFSVVDSNNNPVMLPIFAAATKFNLSPTLLDNLGETFSIFFYNDNGVIHLALATTIKDEKVVVAEMLKQEATLVSDTAFLFLETVPEKNPVKFGEGSYVDFPVRYFNLTVDPPLSVDYIISDSSLVIGTSKDTARAIIDKTLADKSPIINNTPTNIPAEATLPITASPSDQSLPTTTPDTK